ncbi:unnamed protein product, partial [Meganyctiphanes norvegica]
IHETRSIHLQLLGCVEEVQQATERREIIHGCHKLQNMIENTSYILKNIEEKEPLLKVSHQLSNAGAGADAHAGASEVSGVDMGVGAGADVGEGEDVGAQPVIYLDLQADGRPLGRVRIQLTCGPRR